jgi:ATP-dependent DNA helicase DinG
MDFACNVKVTAEDKDEAVRKLEAALGEMWSAIPHEEVGQLRLALETITGDSLPMKAESAADEMSSVEDGLRALKERGIAEAQPLARRLSAVRSDLEFIAGGGDEFNVCWVEQRGRYMALRATPIDVSFALRKHLFERLRCVVLTSATLRTASGFKFVRRRFGMDEAREMVVQSPFDYRRQSLLYLPPDMPKPSSKEWISAATDMIVKLVTITGGRAWVLTTTVGGMRRLRDAVSQRVPFTCLMQGELGTQELIDSFRASPQAVLFATGSFWQGVDVRGLSCVIIDKLPFAVPDDPITAARHKYITRKGGNGFRDLTLPQATISLCQGIGRLIRCESDSGLLAILDPRLQTERYGKMILKSLPNVPTTNDLEFVARRFTEMKAVAVPG